MAKPKQTHCLRGHELTEANRGAEGRCKTCDRERWHERQERIAIMIYDGGLTEEEAEQYCDSHFSLYGRREERQGVLCS